MVYIQEATKLSEYLARFSKLPMTSIQPESQLIGLAEKLPAQTYTLGGDIETKLARVNQDAKNPATTSVDWGKSEVISDLGQYNLLTYMIDRMLDFWSLQAGTGEDKATTISEWLPFDAATKEAFKEAATEVLEEEYGQKGLWVNPFSKEVTPIEPIKLPEFPDIFAGLKGIGKWIAIGGGVLIGAWLLGKWIGRGK